MAAITSGTAEIRLRLNTDDAKRAHREFVSEVRASNLSIGLSAGVPGAGAAGGPGGAALSSAVAMGGSFLSSVLRGGAGVVGGAMAPLFGQVLSDLSTPASVAGRSLSEQFGFGAMARNAGVAQTAADRTSAQLGMAAGLMDAGQVASLYGMNKKIAQMEAKGQNAVYNNPYVADDLKNESAQALVNAAQTAGSAIMRFADELKKTPGRIKEIGSNLGWW